MRAWGGREGRALEAEGTVRAKADRENPPLAHSRHVEMVVE